MRLTKNLRHALLRWNRLILVMVLALPVTVSAVLGFLWLYENGYLLQYGIATVALYVFVQGIVLISRWRARRSGSTELRDLEGPQPDPDWTNAERRAFDRARVRINERLKAPIPWPDLPAEALGVVEEIAADMSGGQRSALDFTVPEALLLIDRVALHYREFLLRNVPLSDRLSVRTMHWIWLKQDTALTAWETGFLAWRGIRMVLNPAVGLLREAERLLATSVQDRLTEPFRRDAQAILLEEAAQAAIDLYSGRLRVSDAELARIASKSQELDLQYSAPADAALRILLVGQKGVGKSSVLNALLGSEVAEVDQAPVTKTMTAYDWDLNGVACRLFDTPGVDANAAHRAELVTQVLQADLVIWVHRANRPARKVDTELMLALEAELAKTPDRRPPVIVHVANGADLLLAGWPRPEHALTTADHAKLDGAMQSIGAVMRTTEVIALRAEAPDWNVDSLRNAVLAALPEARRVQRNRLRIGGDTLPGITGNIKRAGRGIQTLSSTIWNRLRR